jgi:AcrR family transcriptional regulator
MRFAIADGLARALAEAPFDRVKVQRICEIAHVSRQTFYRHFRSKDDIPTWHINHYFRVGTFQIGRTLDWHSGNRTTLRGLIES